MSKRWAILLLLWCTSVHAQTTRLSLEQVINMAQTQSAQSKLVQNKFDNSYWRFFSFERSFLPSLNFDATLPDLNRSISRITLPDGTESFVEQRRALSTTNLSLRQNIGLTGGELFVNSDLSRIDLLGDNPSISYMSTPVNIGLRQTLFGFNSFKWQKKVEPLLYQEAQERSVEDVEDIAIESTNLFFNLLSAQIDLELAELNEANSDTIYKISKGRYGIGKIAENELLQVELTLLNSQIATAQARVSVQTNEIRLKTYLGISENTNLELNVNYSIPELEVNADKAVTEASQSRSQHITLNRQLIEAERDVAQAKGDNNLNMNLFATYGLTNSAADFNGVYTNPQDQQQLVLGIQVPVFNWGVSRANIKQAVANREVVNYTVQQRKLELEQEVFVKALQFNLLKEQVKIAAKADLVAQKRYEIAKQRYLIGRINVSDLNIALQEKDSSKRSYLETLRSYWVSFYELRKLTHYDFLNDKKLEGFKK